MYTVGSLLKDDYVSSVNSFYLNILEHSWTHLKSLLFAIYYLIISHYAMAIPSLHWFHLNHTTYKYFAMHSDMNLQLIINLMVCFHLYFWQPSTFKLKTKNSFGISCLKWLSNFFREIITILTGALLTFWESCIRNIEDP